MCQMIQYYYICIYLSISLSIFSSMKTTYGPVPYKKADEHDDILNNEEEISHRWGNPILKIH